MITQNILKTMFNDNENDGRVYLMKTKKRARGRPSFKDRKIVKSIMIGFRVDPAKHKEIEVAAQHLDMLVSQYCEHCVGMETERILRMS